MVEFKRLLLIFITTPFMALGAAWQIIAGGFFAGRMLMTQWTAKLAADVLQARFGHLGAELDLGKGPAKGGKGLH